MSAASYKGLSAATPSASNAARASSRKQDTKPELELRRALWRQGYRYRKNLASLPGKPDIVFNRAKLVVFVDGDFWHGRDWQVRRAKLERGHNAMYWVDKIERNMLRDRQIDDALQRAGWRVARVWEGEIEQDVLAVIDQVEKLLLAHNDASPPAARTLVVQEPE